MEKLVYSFHEGSKDNSMLLGGKGANLAEMISLKLPVPNGYTVTTDACRLYYENEKKISNELIYQMTNHMKYLESLSGKQFGDDVHPLLVSVRSGSVVSMPGMMDTILNLGLNDDTVQAIGRATNNLRFAFDSYRRFIQMFADVVMHISRHKFERVIERIKWQKHYRHDTDLTLEDLQSIVKKFKDIYRLETNTDFPTDPYEQLLLAVEAVFLSWNNSRAKVYRNMHDISESLGTAVNIQEMVFGNMGDTSGTGVVFTRNPSTGKKELFGEFLLNAQGEDVVAGIRTPNPISSLKERMPSIFKELVNAATLLESYYGDMQDIEFTIEDSKLFLLQTRNGKRTAQAALQIAVDLVQEQIIRKEEAIQKITPKDVDKLLHPAFSEKSMENGHLVTIGLPASPGSVSGRVYFHAADAVAAKKRGEQCLLARAETSPEDIEGMISSLGILTSRGGLTSHAAVVARGMGKACITGCSSLQIDEENKEIRHDGLIIKEGEHLSLDGASGKVFLGEIPTDHLGTGEAFDEFLSWLDEFSSMEVYANADTPKDVNTALHYGASGIGLCRTEHMFFEEKRIAVVRQMILARTTEERQQALDQLLPMQKEDFKQLFHLMQGKPVTIRLLDPPLHEFLPNKEEDFNRLIREMNIPLTELTNRIKNLEEVNPMLGHRGCRLAITFPEIYEMQVKAIIESAIDVHKNNILVSPEIMVPFIGSKKEFLFIKTRIKQTIEKIFLSEGIELPYKIGTMLEIPRSCLTADTIAEEADFFSFGTNDLTQMTYGFSRDDSEKFLSEYLQKEILMKDPFQSIDQEGVGKLMEIACDKARKVDSQIKLGVCGEAGGDPVSIHYFHQLGLSYISCSPYRVPVAKLAAAKVAIKENYKQSKSVMTANK